MSLNNYCLCILSTKESIPKILENLKKIKDVNDQIGPIRKDFTRDQVTKEYYEVNSKLIILKRTLVKKLKHEMKLGKIQNYGVSEFKLRNEHFAFPKTSVSHLYYPLSKEIDCNLVIEEKLKLLESIGFLESNSWFIHHSFGVCEFSQEVCESKRAIIKIMCDFPLDFRVSWCRKTLFSRLIAHYH